MLPSRSSSVVFPVFVSGFLLLTLCLSGCMTMSSGRPPGAWHDAYQPITDDASTAFVEQGLERAVEEFGQPLIPVNQVLLRRSQKTEEARRYRLAENFSLTQCVDSTNGVFVIYIGVDQDHENYYALLGHECAHLINPKITDWYMEGMATAFSEEFCAEMNTPWGDWKEHFMRSRREPYALSYRMMNQMKDAFPKAYPNLIQYTLVNEENPDWRYIDIDAWLGSLAADQADEALDIIEPHVSVLRKKTSNHYEFAVPAELD